MFRVAILILLLTGAVAMAMPKSTPEFDPLKQVPTPEGFKDREAPPTDGEIMEYMWRRFAGDKPMPPAMRKKYGLPPEQLPPGAR
jgi:hypothetical protein